MIENLLTIWGFITLYGLFHPKSTPHKLLCNPPSFLIFQSTPSTYFIYVHFEIFYILKIQFLFNFFLDNEKGAHINKTSTPSCVDIFFSCGTALSDCCILHRPFFFSGMHLPFSRPKQQRRRCMIRCRIR